MEVGAVSEAERVANWRLERLLNAGFTEAQADTLANNKTIDIAKVEWMIEHGATPAVVIAILT